MHLRSSKRKASKRCWPTSRLFQWPRVNNKQIWIIQKHLKDSYKITNKSGILKGLVRIYTNQGCTGQQSNSGHFWGGAGQSWKCVGLGQLFFLGPGRGGACIPARHSWYGQGGCKGSAANFGIKPFFCSVLKKCFLILATFCIVRSCTIFLYPLDVGRKKII